MLATFNSPHTDMSSPRTDIDASWNAETLRAQCKAFLDGTIASKPYLCVASLSTADGRAIALASARRDDDANRIAAMASSLLALSESFSRQILRSPCKYSMLATEHGVIVTVRVPSAKRMHALSIAADNSEMLALVLRHALDTAARLAGILDRSPL